MIIKICSTFIIYVTKFLEGSSLEMYNLNILFAKVTQSAWENVPGSRRDRSDEHLPV